MSQHHAKITWDRNSYEFEYQTYSRDHIWSFDSGVELLGSAAPEYLGSTDRVDPEELLVASISSCHMLTFLSIAARKKCVVDSYVDNAVGFMEKNNQGRLYIARVNLRPKILFALDSAPRDQMIKKMHDAAHRECFIANSVNTIISVEDTE